MKKIEVAKYFDHTLLKVNVDYPNLKNLCTEAIKYNFPTVAIFPCNIELCAKYLKGSNVKIVAALAFPLGSMSPEMKAFETKDAIERGEKAGVEIEADVVINVSAIKSGCWDMVRKEMALFKEACGNHVSKVILENCFLTDKEKKKVCEIAKDVGVSYVKTSTGMFGGATVEDVKLMKNTVGKKVKVKAAGGIRTVQDAKAMINSGAERLGCSASVDIYEKW